MTLATEKPRISKRWIVALVVACLAASACGGKKKSHKGGNPGSDTPGDVESDVGDLGTTPDPDVFSSVPEGSTVLDLDVPPVEQTLRRLTSRELIHVLEDSFPAALAGGEWRTKLASISEGRAESGFKNQARAQQATRDAIESMIEASDMVAQALLSDAAFTADYAPCLTSDSFDADCATGLIEKLSMQLMVADPDAESVASINAGIEAARAAGAPARELASEAIKRILNGADFLYLVPRNSEYFAADPGQFIKVDDKTYLKVTKAVRSLDGAFVARKLALLVWHSVPDAELAASARDGKLLARGEVEQQIKRMLEDPKARRGLRAITNDWFGLEALMSVTRDQTTFPQFNAALATDMIEASQRLFESVALDEKADLLSVLTARYTFVSQALAAVYHPEMAAGVGATGFTRIDLSESDGRLGLLGQPAFLTMTSVSGITSPVKRGHFVTSNFLCRKTAAPPAVTRLTSEGGPVADKYELYERHRSKQPCAGCHINLDPIGMAFESFDSIGKPRAADEDGRPIRPNGEFPGSAGAGVAYAGARDLIEKLVLDDQTSECIVKRVAEHGLGYDVYALDGATGYISQRFRESGRGYAELMRGIGVSVPFRYALVGR